MIHSLCEIQKLAYQLDSERCPRNVLRFHLKSLTFAASFSELFLEPNHNTTRGSFGMPYHSVVSHMAELYRIVSLRSIVTETSERIFHTLR